MTKFSTDSRFLKYTDLSDEHDTIAEILRYDREMVGQGPDAKPKWILYFANLQKGLALNSTNGKTISKALGTDDMDKWKGHRIKLFVKRDVQFKDELVSAIRVRAVAEDTEESQQPNGVPDELDGVMADVLTATSVEQVELIKSRLMEMDLGFAQQKMITAVLDATIKRLSSA